MTDIPEDLIAAFREGRAVLFLGAGAAVGAKNDKGESIPLAGGLAKELIDRYLGPEYADHDFRSAYELACSQRDVLTVQRFIHDRLSPFQPAEFHLLIPTFAWAGLLTTNYDLLIERAYSKAPSRVQQLVPVVRDGDGSAARLDFKGILYVKLHGCITRHYEVHPPLIASTDQLIAFKEGRQGQFTTFLEWAKTKTLIFVGYSFTDHNLRQLFDEIIREGDNRPRHYIVDPSILPAVAAFWNDRRVTAVGATLEQFLKKLDSTIPTDKRKLGTLISQVASRSSFTKFINKSTQSEPPALAGYLGSLIEHIFKEFEVEPGDPTLFYRGFNQGWSPIQANLDVAQTITDEVISDQIIPTASGGGATFVLIKGHGGSGKTVALRRIAWDAAKRFDKLCLFVSRQHAIDPERFEDIFNLTDIPVFLFVDNVSEHQDRLSELIALASRKRAALRIIGTESFNIWNTTCDRLEPYVSSEYEMRYLSEAAIESLIKKLDQHDSLGYLKALSDEKRRHELREVHGRQILVALLEATSGLPLLDKIAEEYTGIYPSEARLLYLDICSLHRFGPPVRAGLISRIHNIQFDEFKAKLFKPLERIVMLRRDPKSGDFVYEARHSHIAHVVYETALKSQEERFDNLIRVLGKLNPSFSYDLEVLGKIIRSENLAKTISDQHKIRQIYEVTIASVGRKTVVLHQRGIYEMHVASDPGGLNRAEEYLSEALATEPYNKSIIHSLAELDLRRARIAVDPLERQSWRRRAEERAGALTAGDTSRYPHHTLLKAAIDDVKDALQTVEESEHEASVLRLGECIQKAEDVLRRGLQKFPNEARLLGEEGELSEALANAPRAKSAFSKAFKLNPRSTLLARRLVRIFRANGSLLEAEAVLRQGIEFNPGSQELHYDLAMTIMEKSPDADQIEGDLLLYHLRRSFSPGDKNHQAQFWYARQLSIADKFEDAKPLFEMLANLRVPFKDRIDVRGIVRDEAGNRRRFHGAVIVFKESYGLIQ